KVQNNIEELLKNNSEETKELQEPNEKSSEKGFEKGSEKDPEDLKDLILLVQVN
ncbi:19714_t:CDS:1, partial [Racocetra persica]